MFLNKLWFILVALAASVALTVAFVAPRSAGRQLAVTEALGLDRAQYAADQMLKTDARRWVDYVAKLGRDAKITEALDNATRGAGEPRLIHESVRSRLGALVTDPAQMGVRVLGAVDASGKVVARIGEGENDYGESIVGLEVVADALAGYMTDSVWGIGGKLTRVAAAPVLAKTRDRVIGAVYVGIEAGDRLAEIWKQNLGVDVAFVLDGQVVTSTVPEGALGTLAAEVAARKAEIAEARRTRAFTLPLGSEALVAVAAPFVGEAEVLGGHYVLMQKRKAVDGPFALLKATTKDDLGWGNFPWLGLGLSVLAMLGVGLFLQHREMEKPLARLRRDMQRLAKGEIAKLDDSAHPGRFGGIARDVNASLERYSHGDGPHSEAARKDLSKILGDDGRERAASLPPLPPLGGPSAAWGSGTGSSGSGAALGFGAQPTPSGLRAPFGPGSAGPGTPVGAPAMGALPTSRLSSPPMPGAPPPPRPPMPGVPALPTSNTPGMGLPPVGAGALSAPAMQAPAPLAPPAGAPVKREMDDIPTQDMGHSDGAAGQPDDWEAHVREVFAEYIEVRARCGEPTKGMTLDKFRLKLEANRETIVQRYACRSARFSVYEKDGKAAIKASPVK